MFDLTPHQITTIRCALELARDKYRENSAYLHTLPAFARLAEQFDQQAADAESLLETIED